MAGDVRRPGSQWRAVGGAPVRWIGSNWCRPLATDVTGESTLAQRSDRRSLRCLGVSAQHGYGAYAALRRGRVQRRRQSALRRSKANSIC
jgi:hypothetical protein